MKRQLVILITLLSIVSASSMAASINLQCSGLGQEMLFLDSDNKVWKVEKVIGDEKNCSVNARMQVETLLVPGHLGSDGHKNAIKNWNIRNVDKVKKNFNQQEIKTLDIEKKPIRDYAKTGIHVREKGASKCNNSSLMKIFESGRILSWQSHSEGPSYPSSKLVVSDSDKYELCINKKNLAKIMEDKNEKDREIVKITNELLRKIDSYLISLKETGVNINQSSRNGTKKNPTVYQNEDITNASDVIVK